MLIFICSYLHLLGTTLNIESVVMKCSQTGKLHTVKLRDLSREDREPLAKSDLVKGSDLMVEMKGKLYPVKIAQFKDSMSMSSNGKSKKKSGENSEKASEKSVKKRQRKRKVKI